MQAVQRSAEGESAIVFLHRSELLGDALLNMPAYRALRHLCPGRKIICIYAEDTAYRTALARIRPEFIDEIRVREPINRGIGSARAVLRSVGQPIEFIVEMRANLRALWTFFGSLGETRRFYSNTPAYFLTRGGGVLPELRPRISYERRRRLVELALRRRVPFDARIAPFPDAAEHAARLVPPGPTYVGVAPGSLDSNKHWPTERHIAFARVAADNGWIPVYLLGPAESGHRAWIEETAPQAVIVDEQAAGGDAGYLPWLIHAVAARLAASVATEGGLGHLIATTGGKLLTLAGPTDPFCWKPMTDLWWLIRAQDFAASEMSAIPVEAVARGVFEMLAWSAEGTVSDGGRR